jgi:hypothetical protein
MNWNERSRQIESGRKGNNIKTVSCALLIQVMQKGCTEECIPL